MLWRCISLHFVGIDCSLQESTALKISAGWTLWAVFTELWLMVLLPGRLLPNAICMHCFSSVSSVTGNGLRLITHAEKWKIQTALLYPICIKSGFNVTSFWALIKKKKKEEEWKPLAKICFRGGCLWKSRCLCLLFVSEKGEGSVESESSGSALAELGWTSL